jgi:quercetin dioxygenase-like cupin family protein
MGQVAITSALERDGFAGPVPLFDAVECARLVKTLMAERRKSPVWGKGTAAASRAYYDIGTDERIVDLVRPALGEDIILWGAQLIIKRDAAVHPFHTDIESADPAGGFVTVWIGLENTSRQSGLKFVPGSHRYGTTIQEHNHKNGIARGSSTDDTTLNAARTHDKDAVIVQPQVGNGEALVFDGRIWHGSRNEGGSTRTALLLQYARADRPVVQPMNNEFPFKYFDERPPVITISGRAPIGINRMATPPTGAIANAAHLLPQGKVSATERFASLHHFNGETPKLDMMHGHSSVLAPGETPHPLHSHIEEEILVVVAGEAELNTASDGKGANLTRTVMGPGDFAYYPAWQWHTIVNTSAAPVLYTMFKWVNHAGGPAGRDSLALVRSGASLQREPGDGLAIERVFETPSRWLDRVHCHTSVIRPDVGYAAHRDRYDVAIILLAGTIETLGRTVEAPAVLYHPAGELHGLRAVGADPARYLVFELDGERRQTLLTPLIRLSNRGLSFGRRAAGRLKRELRKRFA